MITFPRGVGEKGHASVATPGITGLYTYLPGTLAMVPDVQGLESSLVLHTVKGPPGIRIPGTDRLGA